VLIEGDSLILHMQHVVFTCRRPSLVIFSAITAVVINWIITVFIFAMTCEGVVMGRVGIIKASR
jgi:hypothetical protein